MEEYFSFIFGGVVVAFFFMNLHVPLITDANIYGLMPAKPVSLSSSVGISVIHSTIVFKHIGKKTWMSILILHLIGIFTQ